MKANLIWREEMHFDSENDVGLSIPVDTKNENAKGPTPKELVLQGLCGCTAMDVLSILNKMRVPPKNFRVSAETTLTENHPKVFKEIHLKYIVDSSVPEEKVNRAIELSQNQYCGVAAMLKETAKISWELVREDNP